jgi:hypothetical protein
MTWSTIDVAAHVLSLQRAYQRLAAGDGPLWSQNLSGPADNQSLLDATPERAPGELADAIRAESAAMRSALGSMVGARPTFGSVEATGAMIVALNLGDTVLHGFDMCRGLDREWTILPTEAVFATDAVTKTVHGFVNQDTAAGVRATYGMRIRDGPEYGFRFHDGRLDVTEGRPERADCRITANPVPMLLATWGRLTNIETIRAGVLAHGRKPWLAFKFNSLIHAP